MAKVIEATGRLADGPDSDELIYVHEVPYMLGQEVPVRGERGMVVGGEPAGNPRIEFVEIANRRFRSLGHGPIGWS